MSCTSNETYQRLSRVTQFAYLKFALALGNNACFTWFEPVALTPLLQQSCCFRADMNTTSLAGGFHPGGRVDCVAKKLKPSFGTTQNSSCYRTAIIGQAQKAGKDVSKMLYGTIHIESDCVFLRVKPKSHGKGGGARPQHLFKKLHKTVHCFVAVLSKTCHDYGVILARGWNSVLVRNEKQKRIGETCTHRDRRYLTFYSAYPQTAK